MHHTLGIFGLIAAIAFAFGERVARICVASGLLIGAAGFLYIMFRIITETI